MRRSRHYRFEEAGLEEAAAEDYDVTGADVLSFAWQISRGMDYLSGRKVL